MCPRLPPPRHGYRQEDQPPGLNGRIRWTPTCLFQQNGTRLHAANSENAFRAAKFPKSWGKGRRHPNSPALNPSGLLRVGVPTGQGGREDGRLDMAQDTCCTIGKRVKLCNQAEAAHGPLNGKKPWREDEPLQDNEMRIEGDEGTVRDEEGFKPVSQRKGAWR